MPSDPHSVRNSFSILPPGRVMRARAKSAVSGFRSDLGVRGLLPEWRAMLSPLGLREDILAGLTVACIALPLSLAIALATDVEPAIGLISAIVAGIVCAIFGGQQLGVSGPAAAMAVLLGQIVDAHGLGGLLFVGLGCGILQVGTGALGFGRVMRLVPLSVIHGFTAGIGVLILVGQLPRALGLQSPDESHVMDVAAHLFEYLGHANPVAAVISAGVVLMMLIGPRYFPRVPFALIAVAIPTAIVAWLGGDAVGVPLLGTLPAGLPMPSFPALPQDGLAALLGDVLVVYALASLESLLSASAVDKLRGPSAPPHDADQELIGQGLGNIAVTFFGGIPVTSVIARSAINVQAGARTRRSALVHALALIACVYLARDIVSLMPIAALAGVLLATGIRMLDTKYFRELWHASRTEAVVFLVTLFVIVSFDLLSGVQAGCIAALVVALLRLSRVRGELHPAHDGTPHQLSFSGPMTFLTTARLDELRAELVGLDASHGLVLDLRHVDSIDTSAASSLIELVLAWRGRDGRAALLGPNRDVQKRLLALGEGKGIADAIAQTEAELETTIGGSRARAPEHAHRRLTRGVERYREEARQNDSPLLDRLAMGQAPHTLFLTCADSRVSPSLMTKSRPGELFVVRNIGALLPPFGHPTLHHEGAAIEYAIRVLGVRNVVICGHSKCGAMTALRDPQGLDELPAVSQWAEGADSIAGNLASYPTLDEGTQRCSVRQLEHLRSYPFVQRALADGTLQIQAWFYDVETADVLEWDPELERYVSIGSPEEVAVPA
jgi:carbonic anhydrase